jgi:hypothetical protein
MAKGKQAKPVLQPNGVKRLLEGGGEDMTDDERALLLALIGVEADSLDESERAALSKLKEQVEGYDTDELVQAVEHMVTAEPRRTRKLKWPDLKRMLRQRREGRSPEK